MNKRSISVDEATKFGIFINHEKMENGELRFRLSSNDGSSYIRTETASSSGDNKLEGWQNSHFHKHTTEFYLVQSGLLILARKIFGETIFISFGAGEIVQTEPFVPHNVYLRPGSVIHTVKYGDIHGHDWFPHKELDEETKYLTEVEAMEKVQKSKSSSDLDQRYTPYVSIYNNLDSIIWKMPAFLVGGITLLIGISIGILTKDNGAVPADVWGSILAVSSLILFLGTYSLFRLRVHHNIMGEELKKLEVDGYFHRRANTVGRIVIPGAPIVFVVVFFITACIFATASYCVFSGNPFMYNLLKITATEVGNSPDLTVLDQQPAKQ